MTTQSHPDDILILKLLRGTFKDALPYKPTRHRFIRAVIQAKQLHGIALRRELRRLAFG